MLVSGVYLGMSQGYEHWFFFFKHVEVFQNFTEDVVQLNEKYFALGGSDLKYSPLVNTSLVLVH